MVVQHTFDNRKYQLVEAGKLNLSRNAFSILVGKNGTGKSRLLGSIVTGFIHDQHKLERSKNELWVEPPKTITKGYIDNVIAVSTSPFDKFPLPRYRKVVKGYSYLGIRDLNSQNFALGYLSKIMSSLIETLIAEPWQIKEISSALDELGFTSRISIKFYTRSSSKVIAALATSKDPYNEFEELFGKGRPAFLTFNRRFFENEDGSISKTKVNYLIKAFERVRNSSELSKGYSVVEIGNQGIEKQYSFDEYFDDLIFFINSGIIKLDDVTLEKKDGGYFSISGASSGEQSSIISFLGIASKIKDNTLICIDEPEICLHPHWQEKYIKLLFHTFKRYKGCHFIIATHSPQIVSNLASKNSFVVTMEDRRVRNAEQLVHHSADFQLAEVFKSPGFKNEFLTRIAVNTFVKVGKTKHFDVDDLVNYKILEAQISSLDQTDPVLDLILAIKELYNLYA